MGRRSSDVYRRAYELVVSAIDNGDFADEPHFPSVGAFARLAGVSVYTMWKVVNALKSEGRLQGEPGRRSRIPGPGGVALSIATAPRRSKQSALQLKIQRDILNGIHPHNSPLPSAKELAARYGVSRMTLRKTLLALSDDSVLSHQGTRFIPASIAPPASVARPRIVLVGFGFDLNWNITWGYWHQEYVKYMEMECARAGIGLDIVCFFRNESGLHLVNGRTVEPVVLENDPDVLGYLYEVTGAESMDDELLQTIVGWNRPVAILDEVGTWPKMSFVRKHQNIRIFRNTVTLHPARQVARFILELGHRSAVFISPHHNFDFSLLRFQGLQEAFDVPGDARIVPVTSQHDIWELEAEGVARVNLNRLMAFVEKWKVNVPDAYQSLLFTHFELMKSLCSEGRIREHVQVLLERALEVTDATVWIMVNDQCAGCALDFLATRGILVPGDLSIVSFDDLPEAMKRGISSYNFGHAATMTAMLRFISNPRNFPGRKSVVEIEGRLIPRKTTGRPRR